MRTLPYLLLLLSACAGAPDDKDPADDADADTDADTDADADTDTDTDTDTSDADGDGDGYLPIVDCDDEDANVHPGAAEVCDGLDQDCDQEIDEGVASTNYEDADGDGFGDPTTGQEMCEILEVQNGDDCDDSDASVYPGAPEPDCTDPVDYDCDGEVAYADEDGDGAAACEDCDDDDASAYPGATERCDGEDEDCDGTADDGVTSTWYGDADSDGYGGTRFVIEACDAPAGYGSDASDCDDLDDADFPGAVETCDGEDDDCDGAVDVGAPDAPVWYVDADADGYGSSSGTITACDLPAGYAPDTSDCDDADVSIHPTAAEYCDGVDHDCDGLVDEDDAVDAPTWYLDADVDGYGAVGGTHDACVVPSGYVADATDCDDVDAEVRPGAVEACDGQDNDCDGATDESGATGESTWYADVDGDTYGDLSVSVSACTAPTGYGANSTDCDDALATVNPGASELCDDLDNDCDGSVDESAVDSDAYYPDDDGDGFGDTTGTTTLGCEAPVGYRLDGTDCDDGEITTHPYAYEAPSDAVDNDCDGNADSLDTDTRRTGPAGNDASSNVNLTRITVPFCGTRYSALYMQSNGRVTFGSADTDNTEAASDFASDVSIAPGWDDLRSSGASVIEWTEHADAVAFHWVDMPEYTGVGTNTASMVLFDDGRILLQLGTLSMTDGLAGWSCGRGGAADPETDLSAAMAALPAGRWGLGDATEDMYYEVFTSFDNDVADSVIRLCGNVDGVTDPCAE